METISGLIGPLYYLYDLCTCSFQDQIKSLIEFIEKIIILMSIRVIFGFNKFLESLPAILVSLVYNPW